VNVQAKDLEDLLQNGFEVSPAYGKRNNQGGKLFRNMEQAIELLTEMHGTWEAHGSGEMCSHLMNRRYGEKGVGLMVTANSVTGAIISITRLANQVNLSQHTLSPP
jgi:hypothetical protein